MDKQKISYVVQAGGALAVVLGVILASGWAQFFVAVGAGAWFAGWFIRHKA